MKRITLLFLFIGASLLSFASDFTLYGHEIDGSLNDFEKVLLANDYVKRAETEYSATYVGEYMGYDVKMQLSLSTSKRKVNMIVINTKAATSEYRTLLKIFTSLYGKPKLVEDLLYDKQVWKDGDEELHLTHTDSPNIMFFNHDND